MPNGGRILIKLEHDASDNTNVLIVRDNGKGIAPDKLRRIFDPFFSTKSGPDETGKGGTGLGLASCRNIIESHRGRIRVQSTVGKGTAFTIKLPISQPNAMPAPTPVLGFGSVELRSTQQPVNAREVRFLGRGLQDWKVGGQ